MKTVLKINLADKLSDLLVLAFLCFAPVAYCDLAGRPDPNFKAPVIEGGPVFAMARQTDDKLLVAGGFTAIDGMPIKGIARLNPDGSLDTTFTPPAFDYAWIRGLLPMADGSCLVGGGLQVKIGTTDRFGLVKLMTNGAVDVLFRSLPGFSGEIVSIALDESGKILIGGGFTLTRGRSKANIVRLLADGTIDESLNPTAANELQRPTVNGQVQKIAPLADGRIAIAGGFTVVSGVVRNGIALLQADGTVDKSFDFVAEHDCCIQDMMVEEDGKVLVAGNFSNFSGLALAGIVRLNTNGGLDAAFPSLPGPVAIVKNMTASNDQRILLAGAISQPPGTNLLGVVRLFSDGEMDTTFRRPLTPLATSELILQGPAGQLHQVETILDPFTGSSKSLLGRLIQDDAPEISPAVLTDPKDLLAQEGRTVVLAVDVAANPRPAYQWTLNGLEIPGATNRFLKISNIRLPAAGEYQLTIQNSLGSIITKPIRLTVEPGQTGPGSLDLDYATGAGVFGGVVSMQELPDGKVLIAGGFSRIQGISRSRLARLNLDGSVDTSFVPDTSEFAFINSTVPSTNNSIVVMGYANAANNTQRAKIVRLMPDGSVDLGFKAFFPQDGTPAIYVDPNGFVYLSGNQNSSFSALFRLSPDGVRDTSYRITIDGPPTQIVGQADGKIWLMGYFNVIAGRDRNRLARLNADGTLDDTFVPEPIYNENSPERIAVQPDGKILAVDTYYGGFGLPIDQPRARLSRFNSDGSLDLSFFPEWDDRVRVTAMKVQSTGAILLATVPFEYSDPSSVSLVRLFSDGSLDYGFNRETKLNGEVTAVASLVEDGLLVGGWFSQIAGSTRNGIARIRAGESAPVAPDIVRQPTGERISEGADLILDPSVRAAPPASYQWRKDGVDLPGQTNRLLALRNVKTGTAGDYRIVAANASGSDTSTIAKVLVDPMDTTPGNVNTSFYSSSGPNGAVNQVVELPDGKLLIAGNFTTVDHKPCPRITRLNADGSLDEQFNPPVGPNNEISCLAVLDDGQILIGGPFDRIGATNRAFLAALNPDGTLNLTNKIAAASRINRIVIAKDGRILACGEGVVRRWNRNFTPDSTFKTFNFDGVALALDVQSDEKIVVVGGLSGDGGATRQNIARLNSDGSVDKSFKVGSGANDRIDDLAIQPDGKILIAGPFTGFNGVPRGRIARLNIDGSLDTSFAIQIGATGGRLIHVGHFGIRDVTAIHSLLLQPDGHIVITGEFNAFENVPAGNIARLYEDGTIDQNFIAGTGFPSAEGRLQNWFSEYNPFSTRWVIRVQSVANDGMFVMGNFPGMNGVARPRMVKLLGGEVPLSAPVIKSKPVAFEARTGTNLLLYVQVLGYPRTSFQWLHDGQIIAGATGPSLALKNVHRLAAGEYSCLVSNSLGSVQFMAASIGIIPPRVEAGAVDQAFYANWDADFQINCATLETDGKILLAGTIPAISGPWQPVALRLKPDGSTEAVLDFKGVKIQSGNISRAVSLPDGNVLINGSLELIQGNGDVTGVTWARLKPDGTFDPTYNPPTNTGYSSFLIKLSNGKILAGGESPTGPRVYRLNADGTLDKSFAPNVRFDGQPIQAAEDEQGRLLIGGDFTKIGNVRRNRIARLNPDGAVDVSFDPKGGPDSGVTGIGLQRDGGIIISGWFGTVNGAQKFHLARLHPDGSLDATFPKSDLAQQNGSITALVVVPDGRILLAGYFPFPPNQNQSAFQIVRLDSDGEIDPTLNTGSGFEFVTQGRGRGSTATTLGLTPTGKILVTGVFGKVDGLPRNGIVRLLSEPWPRLAVQVALPSFDPTSPEDPRWILLWDEGILEESAAVSGPWRPAEGAAGSSLLVPFSSRQPAPAGVSVPKEKFYRLRVEQ